MTLAIALALPCLVFAGFLARISKCQFLKKINPDNNRIAVGVSSL